MLQAQPLVSVWYVVPSLCSMGGASIAILSWIRRLTVLAIVSEDFRGLRSGTAVTAPDTETWWLEAAPAHGYIQAFRG